MWKVKNQITMRHMLVSYIERRKDLLEIRTKLHVCEKAKGAALSSALDEADDVDPKLHVANFRAGASIEEEEQQDTRVDADVSKAFSINAIFTIRTNMGNIHVTNSPDSVHVC